MKNFKVKSLYACRGHIYIYLLYISPTKRYNCLVMRTIQLKKVNNFQRNAQGSLLDFQNDTNFNCREAHLPMKMLCKFGEA